MSFNFYSKFKESSAQSISNLITEDSSDYISSDVEISSKDIDGNSSSNLIGFGASNLADDSNDSFLYDKDNDSSSASGLVDRRTKFKQALNKVNEESRLTECLDYLHKMIIRKDKEDIFQYPVTDDIAPGYSLIIKKPMDFSTMRKKIDNHLYSTVMEYRV